MRYPDCLVFDIGGTTFRGGVFSSSQHLSEPLIRKPSPSFFNQPGASTADLQQQLLESILATVEHLRSVHSQKVLRHIGIAVPGPTDLNGTIRMAPPLWGKVRKAFPLKALVEKHLKKVECVVINDLTAAAARYAHMPRFRPHRWICVVTVSTGVGNKVLDTKTGEALLDPQGISGEIGHVTVNLDRQSPICDCGRRGHLSAIASGGGTVRFARQWARTHPTDFQSSLISKWTGKESSRITTGHLAQGARAGDRFALTVLDYVTLPMAQALSVLVGSVGIGKIILVGGFALGVGKPYLSALRRNLIRVGVFGRSKRNIMNLVCLGNRDDDSGLIGAGLLAQRQTLVQQARNACPQQLRL
ncbi:MAG: ROK family protein [Candidatus Binatia bacterium]